MPLIDFHKHFIISFWDLPAVEHMDLSCNWNIRRGSLTSAVTGSSKKVDTIRECEMLCESQIDFICAAIVYDRATQRCNLLVYWEGVSAEGSTSYYGTRPLCAGKCVLKQQSVSA